MVVLTLTDALGEGAMAGNALVSRLTGMLVDVLVEESTATGPGDALVSRLTEVLVDALVDEGTATGLGDVSTEAGLGDTVMVTRKVKFVAIMLPTSSNSTPI